MPALWAEATTGTAASAFSRARWSAGAEGLSIPFHSGGAGGFDMVARSVAANLAAASSRAAVQAGRGLAHRADGPGLDRPLRSG